MPKNNLSFLNSTFPKARLNKPTIRIVPQNKRNYQTAAEAPSTQSWIILGGLAALGIVGLAVAGSMRKPAAITTVDDFAQKRLRATYGYVAGGLATTALASVYMFNFGVARRIVLMNPWLLLGVSLFGTIGTMMAMYAIPKERKVARHVAWMAFNLCTGATLSPLGFLGGPVIMKAMLGTGAVVGGLSLIAATAPDDTFLWMGGPLGLGLGVLLAASLGQMFFPTSAFLTNVTLYGGLGLFGLMVLYDTQRVKERAKIAPATQSPEGEDLGFDPMTESLGVYLDTINIFIRMAQIMAGAGQRSRK
jgi:FtsH-binding integral membrane protein